MSRTRAGDRPVAALPASTVARLRAQPWSYDDPGVTRDGGHGGALGLVRTVDIDGGAEVFERVTAGLLAWQVHARAGLRVAASSPVVEPGAVVTLGVGPAFARLGVPCRVVHVVDEPTRAGFAYGTLPGHPEAGEELFVVTRDADRVTFAVTASSRPATALARWGGPVTRRVQHLIVGRYLDAARALAAP